MMHLMTLALAVLVCAPAWAGKADVVDAEVGVLGDGRIQVSATIRHADSGWDHYADQFEVLDGEGNVIETRELLHPHVDEQPFTRSTQPFTTPVGTDILIVRARDSRHGYGGKELTLPVP